VWWTYRDIENSQFLHAGWLWASIGCRRSSLLEGNSEEGEQSASDKQASHGWTAWCRVDDWNTLLTDAVAAVVVAAVDNVTIWSLALAAGGWAVGASGAHLSCHARCSNVVQLAKLGRSRTAGSRCDGLAIGGGVLAEIATDGVSCSNHGSNANHNGNNCRSDSLGRRHGLKEASLESWKRSSILENENLQQLKLPRVRN